VVSVVSEVRGERYITKDKRRIPYRYIVITVGEE
jgi:hypothetical protein